MANTYTQLYTHIIFSVQGRLNLISESNREELQRYIVGVISKRNQKVMAIFVMPDHVHILVGIKPNIALSDLVRDIKTSSSKFISEKRWIRGKFSWQEGFGAFSYSKSQVNTVVKYILNQKEHHKVKSFKEEYIEFLEAFEVEYDDKYLFDFVI